MRRLKPSKASSCHQNLRTHKGIALVETLIAAALIAITVSGSIYVAAGLSRSGMETRLRAEALNQGFSVLEAARYERDSSSVLEKFATQGGRLDSVSVADITVSSSSLVSTTEWTSRGNDEQVKLENALPYDAASIVDVAEDSQSNGAGG